MSKVVTISEAASIAMHGMIIIARSNKVTNVLDIADATLTSKHHVAKVLQRLVKEGFLTSQRGPTGGFILKKDPKKINLLSIYESIEGKIEVSKCFLDKQICPFQMCFMNNITLDLTVKFKEYMETQTLDKYI